MILVSFIYILCSYNPLLPAHIKDGLPKPQLEAVVLCGLRYLSGLVLKNFTAGNLWSPIFRPAFLGWSVVWHNQFHLPYGCHTTVLGFILLCSVRNHSSSFLKYFTLVSSCFPIFVHLCPKKTNPFAIVLVYF